MYVIAGATGRTGARVAGTMLQKGMAVRVLVRETRQAEVWRARGAEAEVLELEDAGALEHALASAHAFYALVPDQAHERMAIVDAMVTAVRARGLAHVVLLSAAPAALSEGNGPCAVLHQAERRLREVTKLCALRPCTFQETMRAQDGVYFHFLGARPAPLVATCDVAAHAVRCLLAPRDEVVDVVGPVYTGAEIAKALNAQLVEVSQETHHATLLHAGVSETMARLLAELYACLLTLTPCGDRLVAGTTRLEQTLFEGRGN